MIKSINPLQRILRWLNALIAIACAVGVLGLSVASAAEYRADLELAVVGSAVVDPASDHDGGKGDPVKAHCSLCCVHSFAGEPAATEALEPVFSATGAFALARQVAPLANAPPTIDQPPKA